MITRPLDLASKLRREPRSNDWLFFVNGGLLVGFFCFFGSPYVLAPSIAVDLPEITDANRELRPATHFVTVTASGQILIPAGPVNMKDFETWLADQIGKWKQKASPPDPVLRIMMDRSVDVGLETQIAEAAYKAGFKMVCIAALEPKPATGVR